MTRLGSKRSLGLNDILADGRNLSDDQDCWVDDARSGGEGKRLLMNVWTDTPVELGVGECWVEVCLWNLVVLCSCDGFDGTIVCQLALWCNRLGFKI